MEFADADDPMHVDEGAFREMEARVAKDLSLSQPRRASTRQMKAAHCIPARLRPLPEGVEHQNRLRYYEKNLALYAILDTMKGKYLGICKELDRSPTISLVEMFNDKLDLLGSLGEAGASFTLPVVKGVRLVNKELPTLAADYQEDASEEEQKTRSSYQYDGNKGCLIVVTLIPVGRHLNQLRLPELTVDELLELLGPVIKLHKVEAGVDVLTPLTIRNRPNDPSQQQFKLSCHRSKELILLLSK
jgi:hypothetical protein